jgi:DNA polymerase delta subunit 1
MLLMDKLLCMYNYVEMARVTGTPINFLLNRGQMIKVTSQLLRKARECGYVLPTTKSQQSDDKFEGATVLEPTTGFYEKPIATLDFASLYPSIMMAHNLCYCTLVPPDRSAEIGQDEVTLTPSGCKFVKSSKQKGLLPRILEELLSARKKAKKEMAEATDPLTKSVLNGRQLALKISANSVYGFTGATVGMLPCLEISSSVTAFGRTMIEHTKNMVEAKYTIANGYAHDAQVIYGDTDSVFVKFGVDTVQEAMSLGEEAADLVSTTFIKPIKLEFEKVYFPYLLLNKKRYAGLYWTKPEAFDKLDTKGIETVRRDNCGMVKEIVETVLHRILIDRSISSAKQFVQSMIADLLQNKVDLSLLVITKSLGKGANAEDYAAKQAHVEVAEKMRKRDPTTAPGSGDRVPYVITTAAKNVPAYARAEDPLYVLENNLPIDAQYYIDHQLQQPLRSIFGPILPNAESELFKGDHTRKVTKPAMVSGPMARFVKKGARCLGCKAVISSGSLCKHCETEKGPQAVLDKINEFREKEAEFNKLWAQCQACQGSKLQVICSNRDCDIFYRRARARRDVELSQEQYKQLQVEFKQLKVDMQW